MAQPNPTLNKPSSKTSNNQETAILIYSWKDLKQLRVCELLNIRGMEGLPS